MVYSWWSAWEHGWRSPLFILTSSSSFICPPSFPTEFWTLGARASRMDPITGLLCTLDACWVWPKADPHGRCKDGAGASLDWRGCSQGPLWRLPSQRLQRERALPSPSLPAPRAEVINSCSFKPPSLCHFVTTPLGK